MGLNGPTRIAVRELSRHWCVNPFACDTPDGMLRWWFPPGDEPHMSALSAALEWMERQGLIEALPAADHRVRYRRASGDVEARLRRLSAGVGDGTSQLLH